MKNQILDAIPIILLGGLSLVFVALSPSFQEIKNISNILVQSSATIILAPGMAFILNLNLWRSSSISDWSLMGLSNEDLEGTETGVKIRLPDPDPNSFYQVEVQKD